MAQDTSSLLFPEIQPYNSFRLKVDSLHEIYVEEVGNPAGKPVLFVHGGPGGGITEKHRRYFDPDAYRVVLFDQRGAGRSTPYASLEQNTTWDLVEDMETIRKHLGIEEWMLFGGSWGSTLSLAYATKHPESITDMILRGIFLCRDEEIQWFYQQGADRIFPEAFEEYCRAIPEHERSNMIHAFHRRLNDTDPEVQLNAARAWSLWEGSALNLVPDPETMEEFGEIALALARIENHFFFHNCFFDSDNYILENVEKFRHIPSILIHGRYDMVCPVKNAYDLHKAWPESSLVIVPDAGHAGSEEGIIKALLGATEERKSV
ncbi:MAG: prolyl aminopeptidase [Spirochaetaceae bacterium]|nr:prolyl aminopeptidase [Spirochaetaceae bacterium]|tara:strand:+ start:24225 stop:25181 length:957 start_codon:yes stop_codon:yes gene_type:complete